MIPDKNNVQTSEKFVIVRDFLRIQNILAFILEINISEDLSCLIIKLSEVHMS